MVIRNFAEARQALKAFYNEPGSNTYTLARMRKLMAYLGNPQDSLHVVHVAGTSGKTSTAYYAAALLEASGTKVGLTVSPHSIEINERVQINHTPLPEQDFCKALGEFMDVVAASGVRPSYFELMVALVYHEFARRSVDYAVIEVGLGGLLDGTNVISRADKVCVITDIGLDHTTVLGNTLGEIAEQKAGIIQPHNHVFVYRQPREVMKVVRAAVERQAAVVHEIGVPRIFPAASANLPLFQRRNLFLAEQAVDYVLARDGQSALTSEQRATAAAVHIPGRMEVFEVKGKTLVVDGAHNGQKMRALLQSMRTAFPNRPAAALVGVIGARDERWKHALDALADYADHIIVTAYDQDPDDMPKKFIPPPEVAAYLEQKGKRCIIEPDLEKAYTKLLVCPETLLLVTGSLYLFSGIRPLVHEDR